MDAQLSSEGLGRKCDLGDVDIFSREHKRNPFPFYARLREEAPVAQLKAPILGEFWMVTHYADVVSCLKDAKSFVKDPRNAGEKRRRTAPRWLPPSVKALEQNMGDSDDPNHRRLRTLVTEAFSRRRIEALRERIEAIVDELLWDMAREGETDLVRQFALPLPLTVICEMLGIPATDQHKFHKWSAACLGTSKLKMFLSTPTLLAFIHYIKRMYRSRRTQPGGDLVSALIEAREDEDRLSENELIAMVVTLAIAGHETTVNLIGSGTLALLEHPDQKERLIENPSLISSAIEELLRFTSPVETATTRYATQDIELGGALIRRGNLVLAAIASANRDERTFPNPDDLDLSRDPNPHVALGDGVHYCLGHQLARMEAEIAFARLFERFRNLKLAKPVGDLVWRETPIVRGLEALPVKL